MRATNIRPQRRRGYKRATSTCPGKSTTFQSINLRTEIQRSRHSDMAISIAQPEHTGSAPHKTPAWWKEATVYQIYPASFCDSNGDGIGDLRGIISKIPYLKSLGIDVVWLCPIYKSPQRDMGYDISDYRAIHPPYGTLEDWRELKRKLKDAGIRIIMDLVVNHTSDENEWFRQSRSSREDPKRSWYYWQPAKYDSLGRRQPPNNWRSFFGAESAWEWDEGSGEYYLRLFTRTQPDLNCKLRCLSVFAMLLKRYHRGEPGRP